VREAGRVTEHSDGKSCDDKAGEEIVDQAGREKESQGAGGWQGRPRVV
jgi:hypothetical protein